MMESFNCNPCEREYDTLVRVTKVIDSHTFEVSYPLLYKKWWEFWK